MRIVAAMLRGLRQLKLDVPIDPRTYLGTPRMNPVIKLLKGTYIHFDLEEWLLSVLDNTVRPDHGIIEIPIHVHGLPFDDWTKQLWSILVRALESRSSVFFIELFGGNSKPTDVHEFMGHNATQLADMTKYVTFECCHSFAVHVTPSTFY